MQSEVQEFSAILTDANFAHRALKVLPALRVLLD